MTANRFIRREYLEEIMLSLVTDTVEEEDLTEINELYEIYTSRVMNSLGKTQLYFKQFIITFCVLHRDALANKIHNEVERNNYAIYNFKLKQYISSITISKNAISPLTMICPAKNESKIVSSVFLITSSL